MADQSKNLDAELDALFLDARAQSPELNDGLLVAILEDATQVQEGFAASAGVAPVCVDVVPAGAMAQSVAQSLWSRLFLSLGGGVGVGGLVAAGLAGVWIGLAPPSFIPDPAELTSVTDTTSDLFDGFDMTELMSEDLQ